MRVTTVVVIAAVIVLIATCEASWSGHKHADKVLKIAQKATSHVPSMQKALGKENARVFQKLQAAAAAEATTPVCPTAGFADALKAGLAACQSTAFPSLDTLDPTNATMMAGIDAWCATSACGGILVNVFKNEGWMKCLSDFYPEFASGPVLGTLICTKNNNEFCFAKMGAVDAMDKCKQQYNSSNCQKASKHCIWSEQSYYDGKQQQTYGYCETNQTSAIPDICTNSVPCIKALAPALTVLGEGDGLSQIDLMCHQEDGKYCALAIGGFLGEGGNEDNNQDNAVAYVCNNAHMYKCLNNMLPMIAASEQADATKQFYRCVQSYQNQSAYVDAYCKPSFMYTSLQASSLTTSIGYACARNANGEWCTTVLNRHSDFGSECAEPAIKYNNCSADCNAKMKVVIDDVGCCLATMVKLNTPPEFDTKLYPNYTASNNITLPPPPIVKAAATVSAPATENTNVEVGANADSGDSMDFSKLAVCSNFAAKLPGVLKEYCPIPTAITKVDPCYSEGFLNAMKDLDAVCDKNTTSVVFDESLNDAQAAVAWNAFCPSACVAQAKKVITSFPRCIDDNMRSSIQPVLAMCEKDEAGVYCAIRGRALNQADCSGFWNSTACAASAQCSWKNQTNKQGQTTGYCELNPTTEFLGTVCSSCLSKILNSMNPSAGEAKQAKAFQTLMCSREEGAFCYPLVSATISGVGELGFSTATLTDICNNRTKEKCLIRMMGGAAILGRIDALDQYEECAKYAYSQSQLDNCVDNFGSNTKESDTNEFMINNICRKNSAGSFCLSAVQKYEKDECLGQVMSGSCNTTCSTYVKDTILADLGCCAGNLHQMFSEHPVYESDLPIVANAYGYKPSKVMPGFSMDAVNKTTKDSSGAEIDSYNSVGKGGLLTFGVCASVNATIQTTLASGCGQARGTVVVNKEKSLPISYAKIKSDPKLLRQLLDSLIADFANALGVPQSDIRNPTLSEDTSVSVVVSSRRMSVQAESSGTKFSFQLQSSSDANTQADSAKFDALVASNQLALPAASVVVQNCNCKDASVTSIAVAAPPPVAPVSNDYKAGDTQTASSASTIALLSAVVMVIMSVMF